MNNSFSLQQIQKTGNLDANLLSRQYKLNLMADFLKVNYKNPKLKQSQIADQLGLSTSTLQRYRNGIYMLSPYRINPKNTIKEQKRLKILISTAIHATKLMLKDLKRPQKTSIDIKENSKKTETKNNLKGGSIQQNIEVDEHYLNEVLKNNNRWTLIRVIIPLYSYSYTGMVIIIIHKLVIVQLY